MLTSLAIPLYSHLIDRSSTHRLALVHHLPNSYRLKPTISIFSQLELYKITYSWMIRMVATIRTRRTTLKILRPAYDPICSKKHRTTAITTGYASIFSCWREKNDFASSHQRLALRAHVVGDR